MYACVCFVLQANTDLFSAVQFTVTDVSLAATLTSTATNLFTPTATPTTLGRGAIIGISVSVPILVLLIALVSVVIVCWYHKRYCVINYLMFTSLTLMHTLAVLTTKQKFVSQVYMHVRSIG